MGLDVDLIHYCFEQWQDCTDLKDLTPVYNQSNDYGPIRIHMGVMNWPHWNPYLRPDYGPSPIIDCLCSLAQKPGTTAFILGLLHAKSIYLRNVVEYSLSLFIVEHELLSNFQ